MFEFSSMPQCFRKKRYFRTLYDRQRWHDLSNTRHATWRMARRLRKSQQDWYKRNGFGERPMVSGARVHGEELQDFTGFYPKQIEALKALWKAIHNSAGVELQTLTNQFGTTSKSYEQDAKYGKFNGIVSHYHVSKNKIDCAGLDIKKILDEL